jgi:hypothetical protein
VGCGDDAIYCWIPGNFEAMIVVIALDDVVPVVVVP